MAGKVFDPLQGFAFRVEIPDIAKGDEIGFTKVTGLNEETEIIDYREGNEPPRMRKLRGLTSYGNVTLERGVDRLGILQNWRKQIADGSRDSFGDPLTTARKDVTISLVDPANGTTVLKQWILRAAWPAIKNIEDIDAGTSDPLLESLELAHQGIETREGPGVLF